MEVTSNGFEIPVLTPKIFYGLSTGVKGNAIFVNDDELLHPAGNVLVMDKLSDGSQTFIKVPISRKEISEIAISFNRKFIVIGEKGEKPSLSVYELATQKRLKLLGVPLKKLSTRDWVSIAFMKDDVHLLAVTGHPTWNYLVYDWPRGKVVSFGEAASNGLSVSQVVPNPDDGSMFVILGPGLLRLMSKSEKIWRQYGFSRANNVPLQVGCWIGPQIFLAGSKDGRLLLIDYGELRCVYEADQLNEIHLTPSQEVMTLASNMVSEENKSDIHEVRTIVSFEKGFLYSCNIGEIYIFAKVTDSRWVKKNVIKIAMLSLTTKEYDNMYLINEVTVNPSQTKIVCTSSKTELYISDIFFEQDFEKEPVVEFDTLGNGYHDGPIASISTCLWKPIFLTAGLNDKTIRLWNYQSMKVILLKKFTDVVYSASMHPSVDDLKTAGQIDIRACKNVAFANGGHLFAATRDTEVEVYSAVFLIRLYVLAGHLGLINRLVFGPLDQSLWSCDGEGSLYEWDMNSGQRVTDIFTTQNGQCGLTVGEAVYTVGTDGRLKEVLNGTIHLEIDTLQSSLSCVILGNSGQFLFLGGQKGTVVSMLYPLVHPPKWQEFLMHSKPLSDVIITHDDTTLISTSEEGFLCIWNIVCDEEKRSTIVKTSPILSEVLISLNEMEKLNGWSKELRDRLLEIEGQHEYTIRQITATHEATLRETTTKYNKMVEELKFKQKQLEREHLVEVNKYQSELKEKATTSQRLLEEQEQHFSKRLSSELKKLEKSEELNSQLKIDFERKTEEIEQLGFQELRNAIQSKESVINEKDQQIKKLQELLMKEYSEKEEMKKSLVNSFESQKIVIENLCEEKIKEKEKLIDEITTENGIVDKQAILMKKEIKKLNDLQNRLKEDNISKQKKIDDYLEEIAMLKVELEEKENAISDKDKLIVHITKQNDTFNKDIKFRNTVVEALHQKILPREKELENIKQHLEKKNSEIQEILHLISKKDKQVEALKNKVLLADKNVQKQNMMCTKLKFQIRKFRFELHTASSYAYQPVKLRNKILEISEKYLSKHKKEIEVTDNAFKEMMRQRARMELIIRKLKNRLNCKQPVLKTIYSSNKEVQQLLFQFNLMTSELVDQRRKVEYLHNLLRLSIRNT